MNILKKFVFIAFCIMCSYGSICAQEVNYLEQAYELYGVGKYEQAQKALNMYSFMTGSQDKALEERIRYCLNFQTLARQAELTGDYITAKLYYEGILKYNSQDTQVNATISKLNALIKKQTNQASTSSNSASKKALRIGDKYNNYTICYLDNTRKHGWIMKYQYSNKHKSRHPSHPSYGGDGWRVPSVEEMKLIFPNRYKLGLNSPYWTCTRSKKIANWEFYYTMDFGTGKVKSTDEYKDNGIFYIKNF